MSAAPRRRLGFFGGAFDPPHVAHVALARAAVDQLGLDELLVFPTGNAWHKAHALTPAEHRLAMAQLAFGALPRTVVDGRELRRQGPTYTVDTLHELQREQPGADIYLVMGADQAVALQRWRDWPEIVRIATVCVAAREHLVGGGAELAPEVRALARLAPIVLPPMDVSATHIRESGAHGEGIPELVPGPVARYIDQHHLYRPT